MANPTWPSTLPPPIADTGAVFDATSNALRTQMDAGAAKVRRRFTAVAVPFSCTLKLTKAQVATLRTFVETTLQDVLPFDWVDHRSGATATYRFIERPRYAYLKGSVDRWQVTLSLELMP